MNRKLFWTGTVFVIASAVIFGLMPLMSKFIYAHGVNPITLVLLRNTCSLPFLAILALGGKLSLPLKAIPSGTATVFHFIYPAVVFLGEKMLLFSAPWNRLREWSQAL